MGFTTQSQFLLGLGLTSCIRNYEQAAMAGADIEQISTQRFLHTFLMGMGNKIKVLVQSKETPRRMLSGLQFAQPYL
jgi:SAM-dependent MidA family methyltransferase